MSRQVHPIRLVTQRLSTVQPSQLPHILPSILETLSLCGDVLSGKERITKDGSDLSVLVHKLKTQISSLLQDKKQSSRWAAVALIKTSIETGKPDILQSAQPWVQGLLGLLGKPEPSVTKKAVIMTLTRTFLLTHGQPTLLRELTSPSLAPFATLCLKNVTVQASDGNGRVTDVYSPLLDTVLQSFIKLIPNHPTSLRPFIGRFRSLLFPLLAPTPSNLLLEESSKLARCQPSQRSTGLAQRLHALLPNCAPKNGSSEEWSKYIRLVLKEVNRIADKVFRGITESTAHGIPTRHESKMSSDELGDTTENELGLPAWQGIYAGCERLIGLLQLLQAYVATRTTTTVSVPLGMMFPLLDRILTVLAPSHSRSKNVETQVNSAVPREERDALYSMLPKLHIAAIESYSLLLSRAGKSSMSFIYEIFEQVTWFFQRTETTAESRIAIFNLITQVVEMIGPSFTSENCSHISAILRGACRDLRPRKSKEESVSSDGSKVTNPPSHNADSYTAAGNNRLHTTDEISKRHKRSALRLISVSIALLPAGKVAASTRHEMDQIAVLMKSEQALIAGVLNPARSSKGSHTPDLLPFLSRLYPRSLNTEALLRPRIPLIQRKGGTIENDGSESEEMASASGGDDLDFESRPDVIGYQPTTNLSFEQPLVVTSDLTKIVSDGEAMMDHPEERNASVTSPKRARALDISESIQDQITTSSEPISKRLRLDDEVSNELIVPENEAAYAEETAEAISAAKDSPPPMTKSTSRGQQAADSDSDSEGSFVVPPIILDSDTDEDEDEDEEEQDNMALDA